MGNLILSLTMLCALALLAGSVVLLRRGDDRKRAVLMLIAALVLFGNVAISVVPV